MSQRRTVRTTTLALAALALALTAACSGGSSDGSAGGTDDAGTPGVIAPDGPGDPARTLSPEEAREEAEAGTEPNAADFTFMRMMPVHHQQALDMAGLAAERADDEAVRRMAARVSAAQGPEIDLMNAWVLRNAGTGDDPGEEDHADHDMPGMASEAQLAELAAASGAEFDALFLDLMITHHEGALAMATDVLSAGNDVEVAQLATDMVADQSVEIDRMRGLG